MVDEFLLFEHVDGLELFRLKQLEDLSKKSFNDYMVLMEIIEHVSSFKDCNSNEEIEKMLKLNNVKVLHCDKSLHKFIKSLEITPKISTNIYRGIKCNIHKILKREIDLHKVVSEAMKFSRTKICAERDDNYVVHVGFELEQVEKEIQEFVKTLSTKEIHYEENNNNDYESIGLNRNILSRNYLKIVDFNRNFSTELDKVITDKIITMYNEKVDLYRKLSMHLSEKMKKIAPNTREILGDKLLAKMLHRTGGLMNMAMSPASTIQLIGAEKSLFVCLKRNAPTPKHGLIFVCLDKNDEIDFTKINVGRISREIASKVAVTAKIDCFDTTTNKYGLALKEVIENRMKGMESKETTEQIVETVHKEIVASK